jgi:hypothetical protein
MQCHETVHHLMHAQGIIKMAQYGKVRFKPWTFTEFLVAQKESVTKVHKRLKNVYGVNAVEHH